jgi:LPXTG-site transpeptidase (sortase) family protein
VANVEWTSLPGDVSDPQSQFNEFSTERYYDPLDPAGINNYGTGDALTLNQVGGTGGGGGGGGRVGGGFIIPVTGFRPGVYTDLGSLAAAAYDASLGVTVEIPKLKLRLPVVGVPLKNGTWDVKGLTSQVGWLDKTAFPGFEGNSVLTSHVISSFGVDGPFAGLNKLAVGDKIFIRSFGELHIYEIRSVREVAPSDITILKHEEESWLTLVTCADFDEKTQTYLARLVVRAVLVETRADSSAPGR